jgi:hypothetical protein
MHSTVIALELNLNQKSKIQHAPFLILFISVKKVFEIHLFPRNICVTTQKR